MEQIKCNTTRFLRGVAWEVWQMDPGRDYFVQMPFLMDRRKVLLKQINIPIRIKRLSNTNTVYNCTANKSVNKSVLLYPLPSLSGWVPLGAFQSNTCSSPQLSRQLNLSDIYLHQKMPAPGKECVLSPVWSAPKAVPTPRPYISLWHISTAEAGVHLEQPITSIHTLIWSWDSVSFEDA